MNILEAKEIYNNGNNCCKAVYQTESGKIVSKEVIKYKGLMYLFMILNGEIIDYHSI